MKTGIGIALATVLLAGAAANAAPTLQLDVNGFRIQAVDSLGNPVAFGGLGHTGAINFSYSTGNTTLAGVYAQSTTNGPFVNQNFVGSLTDFTGTVLLSGGVITGGNVLVTVNGGADTYATTIQGGSGAVANYIGGGFKIEGLTSAGAFSDAAFGNVDVTPWFAAQGAGGLAGSFLQFNFDPNAQGTGFSDMDLFVDIVPVPPALATGMATMLGAVVIRRIRRR